MRGNSDTISSRHERLRLKKATAALVAVASLALAACSAEGTNTDSSPVTQITTAEIAPDRSDNTAEQADQIKRAVETDKPIDYYQGNLIGINKTGDSVVVVRPVLMPRADAPTDNANVALTHNFYALVAKKNDNGKITLQAEPIDISNYDHVGLYPDGTSDDGISEAVVVSSDKQLLGGPSLFDVGANAEHSAYGYNIASFGYHPIGNAYFTPTSEDTAIGVMLQGQAINHQ